MLLLLLAAALPASAEEPATVFLARVQAPALEEVTRRVAPELTAAGYRVAFEGCPPALDPACTRPWPTGTSAVAAVDFAWAGEALAIEARVARPDRPVVRLGTLVTGRPSTEATVVAVRTTELVRAGVLALLRAPAPAAAPALQARAAAEVAAPGFFVALGPGLVQSVAGLGSAVGPAFRAGGSWRDWFAAAWVVAPTLAPAATTPEGSAELRSDIAGAELGRRWRLGPRLSPEVMLGGGAYHLRVRGKEVSPLAPATSAIWTPFLAAGGGLGVTLSPHWAVQAELRAAVTRRAPVVRVGDSEAGRTGWPLLVAGVALAYRR
jgi:hypothetical protein